MQLYNDDCLNTFKEIADNSIDLVVTDCPYHIVSGGCTNDAVKIGRNVPSGILRKFNYHEETEEQTNEVELTKQGKLFKHNDIEFSEWLPEVYRVLKDGTHCYIMINSRNLKDLWVEAEKVGFEFQNLLIWDKGNSTPNRYYLNSYELILMLRKGFAKNINDMGCKNILRVPNIMRVKKHPTEKPYKLMQILVENSTQENDIVLDPFMGVGGVGVACKVTNREFIGIEIDEKYFNIAKERLENDNYDNQKNQIVGQLSLF